MKKLLGFFTTLLLTGCTLIGIRTSEEPAYTLISDFGDIQIRHYPAIIVAETDITADYAQSGSIGFNRLVGYIFGNNTIQQKMAMTTPVFRENTSQKIAMTAPVLQQPMGNTWKMAFVMPKGYNLTNLPTPKDNTITLKAIAAKKVAVLRYNGSLTEGRIAEKSQILSNWLIEHQYQQISPPQSAAYDPPWTLPLLRRNEVHIEID